MAKRERNPRFAWLPMWWIRALNDSAASMAVAHALALYADKDEHTCWPSLSTLERECGLPRRTITRSLEHLQKLGLIRRRKPQAKTKVGGKIPSTIYTLNRERPTDDFYGQPRDAHVPSSRTESDTYAHDQNKGGGKAQPRDVDGTDLGTPVTKARDADVPLTNQGTIYINNAGADAHARDDRGESATYTHPDPETVIAKLRAKFSPERTHTGRT